MNIQIASLSDIRTCLLLDEGFHRHTSKVVQMIMVLKHISGYIATTAVVATLSRPTVVNYRTIGTVAGYAGYENAFG